MHWNNTLSFLQALLVYDSLLTLGDEAKVVWKQKINPGAILYYLSRYVGLLNTLLNVILSFIDLTVRFIHLPSFSPPLKIDFL